MSEEIKLQYPVTHQGGEYSRLTMRRPKVIDLEAAKKVAGDAGDREVALFANLCAVPAEVIRELDLLDYDGLQETYEGFLSRKGSTTKS